jgi:DNA polymerase, archaea type
VTCEVDESYTPTIYVSVNDDGEFSTARAAFRDHPSVVQVAVGDERVSFRHEPGQVFQVDVVDLNAMNSVAGIVSKWGSPGEYRCYNVDFSREFRYCLEEEINPLPTHELSQMQITASETELASERVTELTITSNRPAYSPELYQFGTSTAASVWAFV